MEAKNKIFPPILIIRHILEEIIDPFYFIISIQFIFFFSFTSIISICVFVLTNSKKKIIKSH